MLKILLNKVRHKFLVMTKLFTWLNIPIVVMNFTLNSSATTFC